MKKEFLSLQSQRFSIRKYSIGVASVFLGIFLVGSPQSVFADEIITETTPKEVVINQNTTSEYANAEVINSVSQVDEVTSETINDSEDVMVNSNTANESITGFIHFKDLSSSSSVNIGGDGSTGGSTT